MGERGGGGGSLVPLFVLVTMSQLHKCHKGVRKLTTEVTSADVLTPGGNVEASTERERVCARGERGKEWVCVGERERERERERLSVSLCHL